MMAKPKGRKRESAAPTMSNKLRAAISYMKGKEPFRGSVPESDLFKPLPVPAEIKRKKAAEAVSVEVKAE